MRAAIYARMSTDKQSADSPADQIARCREAVDLFAELEQERGEILARLEAGGADVDLDALRPWIVERVEEMRSAFETEPGDAREALRILLGTRRLRVGPDPTRGFRVEGLFVLPQEMRAPCGPWTARACDSVVAGGRFGRTEPRRCPSLRTSRWLHDQPRAMPTTLNFCCSPVS